MQSVDIVICWDSENPMLWKKPKLLSMSISEYLLAVIPVFLQPEKFEIPD